MLTGEVLVVLCGRRGLKSSRVSVLTYMVTAPMKRRKEAARGLLSVASRSLVQFAEVIRGALAVYSDQFLVYHPLIYLVTGDLPYNRN